MTVGDSVKIGNSVKIGDNIEIAREGDCILIGTEVNIILHDGFNSSQISGGAGIDWIKRDYDSYELHVGKDSKGLSVYRNDGNGYQITIGTPVEIGRDVIIGNDITIGSGTEIGKQVTISTNAVMTLMWGDEMRPDGLYDDSPSLGMSMIITYGPSDYDSRSGQSIVIHKGSEIHSMGDNPLKIKPYETGLVFECGNKKVTLPWETN